MTPATRTPIAASDHFPAREDVAAWEQRGLTQVARGLVGSEILKIAADIRTLQAQGHRICNLTVGDFSPSEFRIPSRLEGAIAKALAEGQTNYPPSDGVLELRQSVRRLYERELGLAYPLESILIAGGARPIIYGTYRAIVDPGEKVLYPTPSWNNNHYTWLSQAEGVELVVGPETNFLPTAELVAPRLAGVRLLCVNTPLNPTGTVMAERDVRALAELVCQENARRKARGERALFVMWDQVYWTLTFGDARHFAPPQLVPESAEWTVFVDGISKSFAATGLRVGWTVAPPAVTARMKDILGHVGAWAPRPEQVATAELLDDQASVREFHGNMIREVRARLDALHDGFQAMRREGLAVDSVAPQGAIYLSARFDLLGRTCGGAELRTNEDIRKLLLDRAGFAVVPFQAFGLKAENGWMRLSVGAVSPQAIAEGLDRVREVLRRVE